MNIYAGIGSRSTPDHICQAMTQIAQHLNQEGWVLRSGHAPRADLAFEVGATYKEIFLPWHGFNKAKLGAYGHTVADVTSRIMSLAEQFHPNWGACSSAARLLHMRNVCQVLGADCVSPVKMVICWTPGGKGSGGTGQAIRIAKGFHIPVFDLALEKDQSALCDFINMKKAA